MFTRVRAVALGISVVAALSGVLAGGPARAQTADPQQIKLCDGRGNVPDDVQISACTQVIKSVRSDATVLNTAHFYRGLTYAQTGRCRLAIPDFTAAIKYDPKDSDAYWSRHLCKQELGDTAGAAADRKAAKAIDPRIEEQWMQ
ncbi:tetratricopeptide repeat protein [Reyranella sp.]|uniref:tetratricopeptide repeat protein n=1 Tax=Reyranella sp. TaxID=1929291 RepID=UPI0025CC2108|nr:tetratricopeptide repeat protein [Reyranella sp.]